MSLTPPLSTRGLWVKTAAEQLEKDNETQKATYFLFDDVTQHARFSENETFNRVSRSNT